MHVLVYMAILEYLKSRKYAYYLRSFLLRYYRYRDNIVVHYRDIGSSIIAQP